MTRSTIPECDYYLASKGRTFYKGEEFYEIVQWIMEHVETVNVGKTGCQINQKYRLSLSVMSENKIYKHKRGDENVKTECRKKNYKPKRK